jgi:hypothetical protein
MDNDRHKIWHSDRSPLEEQFCVFKIFEMSAIFKMAAKTRHKKWAVKIQHCPISSKFDMWVDNDVPNWFLTLKNFYRSPFSKWPPQYCTNSTLFDFSVLNWFLTSKNFYQSPFSKWPPQYHKNSKLFDFKR